LSEESADNDSNVITSTNIQHISRNISPSSKETTDQFTVRSKSNKIEGNYDFPGCSLRLVNDIEDVEDGLVSPISEKVLKV
jgi:hypothetical protein